VTEDLSSLDLDSERDHILHKWTAQDDYEPTFIDGADGARLFEAGGGDYLDAFSQSWYAVGGHSQARIADAIGEQAHRLATVHAAGFSTPPRRRLARRLIDLLPEGFKRVFFGSNGSDAVEVSLKLARLATGRQGVVAFSGSYHGASMAAASVTGLPECRDGFGEPVPGTVFTPYPYCYRCPLGLSYPDCDVACADLVERAIETEGPNRVAAIIGEPVIAVSGVVVPPQPFWKRIREIADRYDLWYISDEVVTGFGRCGSWFAMEHYDAVPDVITLGKGLTSGFQPLSAAVLGERVEQEIASRPLYHGMTFEGHSVATAAALANIDALEEDGLVEHAATLGERLRVRLEELAERHRCVGEVRGLGAMWGIELVRNRATRAPFAAGEPFENRRGAPVDAATWAWEELFHRHRVFTGVATNVLELAPPLVFTDADIDELIQALSSVLGDIDQHCEAQ
jgi:adenosylmethionine-8-amino-7-oxononanoate aminotransferase